MRLSRGSNPVRLRSEILSCTATRLPDSCFTALKFEHLATSEALIVKIGCLGLKDEKSWSEPDFSALWCGKVWFKVVGGQL